MLSCILDDICSMFLQMAMSGEKKLPAVTGLPPSTRVQSADNYEARQSCGLWMFSIDSSEVVTYLDVTDLYIIEMHLIVS